MILIVPLTPTYLDKFLREAPLATIKQRKGAKNLPQFWSKIDNYKNASFRFLEHDQIFSRAHIIVIYIIIYIHMYINVHDAIVFGIQ